MSPYMRKARLFTIGNVPDAGRDFRPPGDMLGFARGTRRQERRLSGGRSTLAGWRAGRIIAAATGLSAWIAVAVAAAAGLKDDVPTVTAVRHVVYGDLVRLMLEISPEPAFALFTLTGPDRLIIDMPALDWRADDEGDAIPYVGDMRYGLFRRDRARIVIELTQPVAVDRAFTQPPVGEEPGRLVIDLSPVSRSTFDARAGAPEQARWRGGEQPDQPRAEPGEVIVAIDPGHGGIDPGAREGGLVEKVVVLDFSRRLAAAIEALPGLRAYLTREEDVFVPLAERVGRAHAAGANLMISVHADVLERGVASGVSAYTLSEDGTDDAADALAARENRSDVLAGADLGGETDDVTRLLVELAQRGTKDESRKLAEAVIEAVSRRIEVLEKRPHREANFRVLKAPDIPSVLLELGFLDNHDDRQRLSDPDALDATARAVAAGIARWRERASPGFLSPR
jgi:N-acetylmuramoyl-L-alanine amidase